ncbi:MAG: right-handed parallel beta-helix repeat-containing protein, partial [Chitinophagales bacterium]
AILDANSTAGADVIEFSTSGTLTPATLLPTITESVMIDGTTATGYAVGTPTFHIGTSNFTALIANATDVTIEGIDVSHPSGTTTGIAGHGTGIQISGTSGTNTIRNCVAKYRRTGVHVSGAANYVVENNDLSESGYRYDSPALYIKEVGSISASGNTYGGVVSTGLVVENMNTLTIGDENVTGAHIVLEDNSGINNFNGIVDAIVLLNCTDITIDGVNVSHPSGTTTGIAGHGTGIRISGTSGTNTIRNCVAKYRRTGVHVSGAANYVVENNDLSESGYRYDSPALYVKEVGSISASGNTYGGVVSTGLVVENMSNLTIGDENVTGADIVLEGGSGFNNLNGNVDAIVLLNCIDTSIDGVDVSRSSGVDGIGVNLNNGSGNTVRNLLANNRRQGVYTNNTTNCSITCSTFTNCTDGIELNGTTTLTSLENNTFACITGFAIDNNTGAAITAENNFWEDASGPTTDGGTGENYDGDVDAVPFLSDASLCAPGGANYCSNLVSWSVADITTDCDSDGGTYDVCFSAADLGSVIGLDVTFNYPSQLTPVATDFITLKDLALNPVGGNAAQIDVFENSTVAGEVSASVYFNSSAPLTAAWNGGGEFICFTFEMSDTWDGTALNETITTTEIFESYETSVSAKGAEDATLEIITMIGQINVNGNETTPLVNGSAFNGITEITTADENCTPDGRWTQGLNTDTDGGFSIAAGGSANVRITRNTSQNDLSVIGGSDALRAVFIRLGLGSAPTLNELLAMDVNGDGFASAGDITNILRRSVGLIADYPTQAGEAASDWKFALSADMDALEGGSYDWKTVPVLSQCMAVPADACDATVEYDAVLKGDVVSSWTSGSNFKTAAETSLIVDVAAKHTLELETTYRIPVYAQDIESFFTLDLDLPFDASKVSIEDVVLTELGESYDIQFVWNTPEEGRLMMASYTIQEIDTDQPLFEIIVSEDLTGEEFGAGTSYFNGIASNVEVIDATAVGIEDILGGSNNLTAIQNVHPNPANNVVMIDYSTELTGELQVQVMDLAGRTVAEQTIENNGRAVVDISTLQNGLYIVTLSEDGELKGRAKLMVAK